MKKNTHQSKMGLNGLVLFQKKAVTLPRKLKLYQLDYKNEVYSANITFSDSNVKALCVANWDTSGDGEQ